jgi:predicted nucleic acid-binding protein
MIVDTSALLAFFDTDEPDHVAVSAVLTTGGRRGHGGRRPR